MFLPRQISAGPAESYELYRRLRQAKTVKDSDIRRRDRQESFPLSAAPLPVKVFLDSQPSLANIGLMDLDMCKFFHLPITKVITLQLEFTEHPSPKFVSLPSEHIRLRARFTLPCLGLLQFFFQLPDLSLKFFNFLKELRGHRMTGMTDNCLGPGTMRGVSGL